MLPGVSDDENSVVWIELAEEGTHLPRACQARFVKHVKVPIGGVGAWMILTTGKETLEGRCLRSQPRGAGPQPWMWERILRRCSRLLPHLRGLSGESWFFRLPANPCRPWMRSDEVRTSSMTRRWESFKKGSCVGLVLAPAPQS